MPPPKSAARPVIAEGKRLLMKAALRLSAKVGSIGSVGLRELAREAGVDPTTFYRHFKSFEDLGLAVLRDVAGQLRGPLRELRRQAAASSGGLGGPSGSYDEVQLVVQRLLQTLKISVQLVFDTVDKNPDAFAAGARELRGSLPQLRKEIRTMLAEFSADLAEDLRTLRLLPMMDDATVDEVSTFIMHGLFQLAADYVEERKRRAEIRAQAETFVLMLIVGAVAVRGLGKPIEQTAAELLRADAGALGRMMAARVA